MARPYGARARGAFYTLRTHKATGDRKIQGVRSRRRRRSDPEPRTRASTPIKVLRGDGSRRISALMSTNPAATMHSRPAAEPAHPSLHAEDSCDDMEATGGTAIAAPAVAAADGAPSVNTAPVPLIPPLMLLMPVETAAANTAQVRPNASASAAHSAYRNAKRMLIAADEGTSARYPPTGQRRAQHGGSHTCTIHAWLEYSAEGPSAVITASAP